MSKLWRIAVIFILFFCYCCSYAYANGWVRAKSLDKMPGVKHIMVKKKSMNNEVMELDYSVPEPEVKTCDNSALYSSTTKEIILGNAPNRKREGKPVLPLIPVKLIIPAGRDLDTVKVISGKKRQLPGKHVIKHGQKPIPLMPGIKLDPTLQDKTIYESNNQYPNKLYELVGVQRKRGVAILFVNLNPVVYHPLSGKLSYYETLTLRVKTKPDDSGKATLPYRSSSYGESQLSIDNPEMIETYENMEEPSAIMMSSMVNPAVSYDYLVITSADILSDITTVPYSMNDFIAHKQALGLSVTAVTIEDVLAEYSGVDDAEKLHNFIIDTYINWGISYVLLGGDTNIIPTREMSDHTYGWLTQHVPTDLYYQCLDGEFNSDGDVFWGESTDGTGGTDIDLMAEVYIGRVSAENADEMSNFVYKTLAYENESVTAPYHKSILIASEFLGENFGLGDFSYAMPYMEEIINGSSTTGYTTLGFSVNSELTIETLYDFDYAPDLWPKSEIVDRINSGNYSIINHLGHARNWRVMKILSSDAALLTNDKYFFVYSQGCYPGDYTENPVFDSSTEDDCIAEHLTTLNRNGAFAAVLNSHFGWGRGNDSYDTLDGQSQRFNRQFWDAYFGEGLSSLGSVNADSHEDNIWDINGDGMRCCYYETNLFGDPALCLKIPRCDYILHDLTLYGDDLAGEEYLYTSECSITAGPNFKIETDAVVTFQAASEIILEQEFVAEEGCEFIAKIQ